jgi:hypothetical protein|tara:strand:+ start:531 stop:803 length:273 start_codon:yes stop_codon:yes gene_type:complete
MKAKDIKEKIDNAKYAKLIRLISILSPEDHQKFLNDIDLILCNFLDLKRDDLPWINPSKNDEKWEQIMDNLRLVSAKLEFESQMKKRTIH